MGDKTIRNIIIIAMDAPPRHGSRPPSAYEAPPNGAPERPSVQRRSTADVDDDRHRSKHKPKSKRMAGGSEYEDRPGPDEGVAVERSGPDREVAFKEIE